MMQTTIYFLLIVKVTPVSGSYSCVVTVLKSFSCIAEASMFSRHHINSVLQQHNLRPKILY